MKPLDAKTIPPSSEAAGSRARSREGRGTSRRSMTDISSSFDVSRGERGGKDEVGDRERGQHALTVAASCAPPVFSDHQLAKSPPASVRRTRGGREQPVHRVAHVRVLGLEAGRHQRVPRCSRHHQVAPGEGREASNGVPIAISTNATRSPSTNRLSHRSSRVDPADELFGTLWSCRSYVSTGQSRPGTISRDLRGQRARHARLGFRVITRMLASRVMRYGFAVAAVSSASSHSPVTGATCGPLPSTSVLTLLLRLVAAVVAIGLSLLSLAPGADRPGLAAAAARRGQGLLAGPARQVHPRVGVAVRGPGRARPRARRPARSLGRGQRHPS